MIPFFQWTIAVELIGLAFLPITVWTFQALPDRGYIFSKILGLVVVTYITWLVGSFIPIAGSVLLPELVVVVAGALGWWYLRTQTVHAARSIRTALVVEECLFLAALVVWSLLRSQVFHPGIDHTEQYMDMSFLGASIHSVSFPPYDPWMSGHTINYYYMGYLMFGLLVRLSGVVPTVGYNLALSTIFALVISGSYSLAYCLTRRYTWAALAPVLVALVGNWHGILVQVPAGHNPASTYYWFWDSTRVLDNTINEFPFFSFMLGDLHPHVMGLPVALLVLAFGCNIMFEPGVLRLRRSVSSLLPLALLAVTVGMLFTINSWDFPTYLLVAAVCIAAHAYVTDDSFTWWRVPTVMIAGLSVVSLILYTPFFAHFQSLTKGVGWVSSSSDLWPFVQIFGLLLLPVLLLVGSLALLLQPNPGEMALDLPYASSGGAASEAGAVRPAAAVQILLYGALFTIVVLGARYHLWVMLLVVGIGIATLLILHRVVNTEEPNRGDSFALILVAVACLMLALPEVIYVRDSFDGSGMYRMNTVFKFYYQAWLLLGVAGAYGIFRGWHILREHVSPSIAWLAAGVVAMGILGGGYYTVSAPQSANQGGTDVGLDGASALQRNAPGDYAVVEWLRTNARGTPTELEATGGEYDTRFARIATFTGLPTVLGWAGHEFQWRGADPEIQQRVNDIKSIYTTTNQGNAEALLHKYGVKYVIVGDTERTAYPGSGLAKFGTFMRPVLSSGGTTLYAW
ncbi:MAG TPA: DUF2298 domain-containing protein [Chloroflexota bacterium]